jgi:hypothetical protein
MYGKDQLDVCRSLVSQFDAIEYSACIYFRDLSGFQ